MKNTMKIMLAALLCALLALPVFALAEDTAAVPEETQEQTGVVNEEAVEQTEVTEQEEEKDEEEEIEVTDVDEIDGETEIEVTLDQEEAEEEITDEGEAMSASEESYDGIVLAPVALELTYTGEPQALVEGEGFQYSLDGETFSDEIPTAINAGEYTVFYRTAEGEPEQMTVTVAKADVVLVAPVAINLAC
jgi:hypothetical protein